MAEQARVLDVNDSRHVSCRKRPARVDDVTTTINAATRSAWEPQHTRRNVNLAPERKTKIICMYIGGGGH